MVNQTLEDRIYEYIDRHIGTTFAELSRDFPEGFNGEYDWFNPKTNTVLWTGLTQEMLDTLMKMQIEQKIVSMPSASALMMYVHDGEVLSLQIAKGNRNYAKPRWEPIVFYTMKYFKNEMLPFYSPKVKEMMLQLLKETEGRKFEDWKKEHNWGNR